MRGPPFATLRLREAFGDEALTLGGAAQSALNGYLAASGGTVREQLRMIDLRLQQVVFLLGKQVVKPEAFDEWAAAWAPSLTRGEGQ